MHIPKRIIPLLAGLVVVSSANAQNKYHIAEIKTNASGKAGVNPRFLNRERDDLAEGQGWKALAWDTATNGYTLEEALPFAFSFNGAGNVKLDGKFRATKNGTITFNDFKASGTALPAANFVIDSLPDPRIANNSVIVGGIIASGTNDRVVVKTFGNAPHRQFWVKFQSYTLGTDTANKYGSYSYNAIVLEEGSNAIHVVRMGWGSEHAWYANNLPIKNEQTNGIQLGPFESYPLAGVSSLLDVVAKQGKDFSDNSFVSFYTGTEKLNDASFSTGFTNKPAGTAYVKSGNQVPLEITGVFTMHGSTQNTDYNLNTQVNNDAVVTTPLSFVNFTDYRSAQISHTIFRDMQPADRARVRAWISPNGGGTDDRISNDTLPLVFDFVAQQGGGNAVSKALVESYTATWCSQCPAVNVALDSLETQLGGAANFITHHINDNMHNKLAPLEIDSMPLVVVNRQQLLGNASEIKKAVETAVAAASKGVELKFTNLVYNPSTRKVTGTMEMTAQDAWVKSGLRFGVMLREQGVRGLGAGWDQKVDFALTKDSQSIFFGKNKTLVGYYHNRVIWSVDGGKHGATIPSAVDVMKSGDKYAYAFTLTIPDTMLSLGMPNAADFGPTGAIYSRFKPADLSVVGYVASDFGAGINEETYLDKYEANILTSVSQPLWDMKNGIAQLNEKQALNLYPNPANGWVSLGIDGKITEVLVFDISGRMVQGLSLSQNRLDLHGVQPGLYFIRVKTQKGSGTARLLVD